MDERETEEMEKIKALTRVLGLNSTVDILHFICERTEATYGQLQEFVNTHTLNVRLRELIKFGLIEHHLERENKRREWYTITPKGRETIELCRKLGSLIN